MTDGGSPRVVLVGAGHAHLHVLRHGRRFRRLGIELLVVDPDGFWYSGLATGMLGGMYDPELDWVDPRPLARAVGARFLEDRAVGTCDGERTLRLDSGRTLEWDVLSLNVGSRVDPGAIEGAEHARRVKPISELWDLRREMEARFRDPDVGPAGALVVGGGASGCEVAANLTALARRHGGEIRVTLATRASRLIPGRPAGAARRLARHLEERAARIVTGCEIARLDAEGATAADGRRFPADHTVLATGLVPARAASRLGLPTRRDGGLAVDGTLRASGRRPVFGAGDCISLAGHELPRLGVFAVRQAPVLLENLLAAARALAAAPRNAAGAPVAAAELEGSLRRYEPQERWLSILNLGDGRGLATWDGLWWLGRTSQWLKDRIDRRFLSRCRTPAEGNG